jgi:hypothetical protein
MTPYAHTDPVMGIVARGFAAHMATTNPQKPIVVVGMWLWMLPTFIGGMFMVRVGIGMLSEGATKREWFGLIGVPIIVLGLLMVWIGGGILLKTTLRYLESSERDEQADEREETIECLQCGHSFAADADACPKCRWTYARMEYD